MVRSSDDASVLGFPKGVQIVFSVNVSGEPRRTLTAVCPFPLDAAHSKMEAKPRFGVESDAGKKSEVSGGRCRAPLGVCRVTGKYGGWRRESLGPAVP